ncbi:hypothetical protein [Pseudoalteromonas ruthenica]|uniref:hypothetical protein n=1 Tax=Pseudoalteromonas ruthenica TaxID=151081 RepID=UPI00241E2BE6|nr:hypothetical protein [Pseudoalteromonas ruthenica]
MKNRKKIKQAKLSETRLFINKAIFSLFCWFSGLAGLTVPIVALFTGHISSLRKYGPPEETYFFTSSPLTFIFIVLLYFGSSLFILLAPTLFNETFFPKKIKKIKSDYF